MMVRETSFRHLRAIDVKCLSRNILSWDKLGDGIRVRDLPTRVVDDPGSEIDNAAVISWRWDVDPLSGHSRNLAIALKHAQETGIDWLFVDLVSIDQTVPKATLLKSVVALANLFASIPVIAAYDEQDKSMDQWSRTLQRPWILSEIRAFCQNPTRVTYVGYRHSQSCRRELSFANEVSQIRSAGYAACILEILSGRVEMTDIADFAWILAEFDEAVAACYSTFNRADYLLAVFLLTAKYEPHQWVSRAQGHLDYGFRTDVADPMLERVGLERFSLGPFRRDVGPFESGRSLLLDGHEVAIWRSKMTSSYDRNWIQVVPEADKLILDVVNLQPESRKAYVQRSGERIAFLHIESNAPRPSINESAADLTRQQWLEQIPEPKSASLGFRPELW